MGIGWATRPLPPTVPRFSPTSKTFVSTSSSRSSRSRSKRRPPPVRVPAGRLLDFFFFNDARLWVLEMALPVGERAEWCVARVLTRLSLPWQVRSASSCGGGRASPTAARICCRYVAGCLCLASRGTWLLGLVSSFPRCHSRLSFPVVSFRLPSPHLSIPQSNFLIVASLPRLDLPWRRSRRMAAPTASAASPRNWTPSRHAVPQAVDATVLGRQRPPTPCSSYPFSPRSFIDFFLISLLALRFLNSLGS